MHARSSDRHPVQISSIHPVVLLSFISRFTLVRQQIGSITTGSQKNIWSRWPPKRGLTIYLYVEAFSTVFSDRDLTLSCVF